jgi:hypothetical protein
MARDVVDGGAVDQWPDEVRAGCKQRQADDDGELPPVRLGETHQRPPDFEPPDVSYHVLAVSLKPLGDDPQDAMAATWRHSQ